MTTLRTTTEGARVVAKTPTLFRTTGKVFVVATEFDGTLLGCWWLSPRHWLEDAGPLICAARRHRYRVEYRVEPK